MDWEEEGLVSMGVQEEKEEMEGEFLESKRGGFQIDPLKHGLK